MGTPRTKYFMVNKRTLLQLVEYDKIGRDSRVMKGKASGWWMGESFQSLWTNLNDLVGPPKRMWNGDFHWDFSHMNYDIRHVKYDELHPDLFVWLIKLSHSPPSVHAFAAPFAQQPQSLSKTSGESPQYKRFHLHIFSWMEPYLLIWHQASGGKVTEKLWHHRIRFDIISFLANSAIFAALANSFSSCAVILEATPGHLRGISHRKWLDCEGISWDITGASQTWAPENSRLEHHGTHPSQCRTAA